MDTIELMRVFVAVSNEGSFTACAKRLGMPVQTVSKYVRQLEERLKVQLFDRTTRSVALNDTGKAYLDRAVEIIDQFDEVEAAVKLEHGLPKGRIRLTAPTAFGEKHLAPTIAEFLQSFPDIKIELNLTNRRVSLVEEGYDLGIRLGQLKDSSMVARRLAPMRVVMCASKEYIRKKGVPDSPNDLKEHACLIENNLFPDRSWPFVVNDQPLRVPVSGPFEANTPEAVRKLMIAGVGIGMCPMYVVNSDIVTGRLTLLLEEYEALAFGVYAIYPHRRHLSARVRGLVEYLAKRFRTM